MMHFYSFGWLLIPGTFGNATENVDVNHCFALLRIDQSRDMSGVIHGSASDLPSRDSNGTFHHAKFVSLASSAFSFIVDSLLTMSRFNSTILNRR